MDFRGLLHASQPHPHEWDLPHRFTRALKEDERPQIPDHIVFNDVSGTFPGERSSEPTTGDLAVYLCLLECFHNFKQEVLRSESLDVHFQGLPQYEGTAVQDIDKAAGNAGPRNIEEGERKWSLVVKVAVARFEAWRRKIKGILKHAAAYASSPRNSQEQLTKDYLPPLDVVMVWHSFALNNSTSEGPDADGEQQYLPIDFPWKAIHDTIDCETFTFNLTKPAQSIFSTQLGQSADLLTYICSPPVYSEVMAARPSPALVQSIHAHETLVNKSHELLWIRSPALSGTLHRALQQYLEMSLALVDGSPETFSELPLTVSLVLNCHQLSELKYSTFTNTALSTSKAEEDSRHAPATKSTLPSLQSLNDLSNCLCWTCEAIRSANNNDSTSVENLTRKQIDELKNDLGFHQAVESARKAGLPLPTREKPKSAKNKPKFEAEYGLNYYEEVIPAKYDKDGKLIKKEQRKVRRQKGYTSGFKWVSALI